MPLIPCNKPINLDENYVGECVTVKGHRFMGRYDLDGNYYEHHVCCDKWFRLVDRATHRQFARKSFKTGAEI